VFGATTSLREQAKDLALDTTEDLSDLAARTSTRLQSLATNALDESAHTASDAARDSVQVSADWAQERYDGAAEWVEDSPKRALRWFAMVLVFLASILTVKWLVGKVRARRQVDRTTETSSEHVKHPAGEDASDQGSEAGNGT